MIYTMRYDSPLGGLLLAASAEALAGLWMEGQKYFPAALEGTENAGHPPLRQAAAWLDRYFAGARPESGELTLAPAGSDFQRAVWDLLRRIPYGETVTYGELALAAGRGRTSAQAVGGAVGRNPISIIIPCHRVVGAGGSLTGYAGGIGKKVRLLTHEGVNMDRLFVPDRSTAP